MQENLSKDKLAEDLIHILIKLKKSHWHKSDIKTLTPSEIHILFFIKKTIDSKNTGIKVSDISKYFKVSMPTITQKLTSLEKNKYITRTMDESDRRVIRIMLTQKGEAAIYEAELKFKDIFTGLVDFLGEDDSKQFINLIEKILNYFEEKNNKTGDEKK